MAQHPRGPTRPLAGTRDRGRRASAEALIVFVLVLIAGAEIVLLSLGQGDLGLRGGDSAPDNSLQLALRGLVSGQAVLGAEGDVVDLEARFRRAAGDNGILDFDPRTVRPLRDGGGEVTGMEGYGDDVPLQAPTKLGAGVYAAFLADGGGPDPGGLRGRRRTRRDHGRRAGAGRGRRRLASPAVAFP